MSQFGMTISIAVCGSVAFVTVALAVAVVPRWLKLGVTVTPERETHQSYTPTALVAQTRGLDIPCSTYSRDVIRVRR